MKTTKLFFTLLLITFLYSCGVTINEQEIVDAFIGENEKLDMSKLKVGDNFQGGKIVYIYKEGDTGYKDKQTHGIIVAFSDLAYSYTWYNGVNVITGAKYEGIGKGLTNTTLIINSQGAGEYAARACMDLESGGYSDWVLPTIDELNLLYENKDIIGNFVLYSYWSSTEINEDGSCGINFKDGKIYNYYKDGEAEVRPIRYF